LFPKYYETILVDHKNDKINKLFEKGVYDTEEEEKQERFEKER
jgi:hypothetical protein